MCKKFNYWWLLLIVVLIVAPYVVSICGKIPGLPCCELSPYPEYWGAFGSYFGGMVSIISIILLYCNLHTQTKEFHRLNIEEGFKRLCSSINEKALANKDTYDAILKNTKTILGEYSRDYLSNTSINDIIDKIYGSTFKDYKQKMSVLDLYNTFSYIVRGIKNEESLIDSRKEHYLQNLLFSLPISAYIIILLHAYHKINTQKQNEHYEVNTNGNLYATDEEIIEFLEKYDLCNNVRTISDKDYEVIDNMEICSPQNKEKKESERNCKATTKERTNFLFMLFDNK